MKLLLSLILISIASSALASKTSCEIEFYPKIFLPSRFSVNDIKTTVKNYTCSDEIINSAAKSISNYNGTISSKYLTQVIRSPISLTIKPKKIQILQLSDLIKKSFYENKSIFITEMKLFSNPKVIRVEHDQEISLRCANCSNFGEKNIEINIRNLQSGAKKTYWASVTIKTNVMALSAVSHIPIMMSPLKLNNFVFKPIKTVTPTIYFTQRNRLKYFRLNKAIIKGSPLRITDMTPIFLVKPGNIAELVFDNGLIKLGGKAYPKQRGRYGETIKLTHPRSGKAIFGKVIGKNKVLVQI